MRIKDPWLAREQSGDLKHEPFRGDEVNGMATTIQNARAGEVPFHRGPSLGVLGIVYVALFVSSLVVAGVMTGGARFPRPYEPVELARDYFTQHADAVRIAAFLQFGSAIPLGLFTATVTSRLRFLGMNVAGVEIALFGGFASSIFLALSALTGWVLSQPGVSADAGALRTLQLLGFVTGGPGHVVTLGLLLAGVSVPSAFARLLPRWLVWLGLIVAVIAEFSSLSLVFPMAGILLPLGRFPAFIWLIGAGFSMPRSRGSREGEAAP
jgi:hypothetical protein